MTARILPFARVVHRCAAMFGGFCRRCAERGLRKEKWLRWSLVRGRTRRMIHDPLTMVACRACRVHARLREKAKA